jgi:6-phosphofructokinase 1
MEAPTVVFASAPAITAGLPHNQILDLKLKVMPATAPQTPARKTKSPNKKLVGGGGGYVLEDVPHLTDFLPQLQSYPNPLQDHPAYSVVK